MNFEFNFVMSNIQNNNQSRASSIQDKTHNWIFCAVIRFIRYNEFSVVRNEIQSLPDLSVQFSLVNFILIYHKNTISANDVRTAESSVWFCGIQFFTCCQWMLQEKRAETAWNFENFGIHSCEWGLIQLNNNKKWQIQNK